MKKLTIIASSLVIAALPFAAFAQTITTSGGVNVSVPAVTATVNASTSVGSASISKIIARADAEIQRRITNLNALSTRIGEMKRLSSTEIASLQAGVSAQISQMNSLEATINAETTLSALKTSVQSITIDYRIYMLVLPQGRVAAAADRIQTIVADMQTLEPKLETRINSAGNPSAAVSAYADMQTQVSNAASLASAAVSETVSLTPDQGNTTVEASNTAAIKDAASKIKTATADLVQARKDIATILQAVKGTGSVTASSSASV